jgi:protein-tyrosine phosphatase
MRTGRVDVHSHLLPAVDDGCQNVQESIVCARALVAAGYTHAFCTPHVWPNLPENNAPEIRRRVDELQAAYEAAGVPLIVRPGGEHNLLSSWPGIGVQPLDEIVTYDLAGRYLLFDFWTESPVVVRVRIVPGVKHLREMGFELILAHPERIAALQKEPGLIDAMMDLGVKLQLNSWCLADGRGEPTREIAERLLREGRYFLIGTDTHRPTGMGSRVEGLAIAEKLVGRAAVDRLTIENPSLLMSTAAFSPPGRRRAGGSGG